MPHSMHKAALAALFIALGLQTSCGGQYSDGLRPYATCTPSEPQICSMDDDIEVSSREGFDGVCESSCSTQGRVEVSNVSADDLEALSTLEHVMVLDVNAAPWLRDLTSLSNLRQVGQEEGRGGKLRLFLLPRLESLEGLEQVKIHGTLDLGELGLESLGVEFQDPDLSSLWIRDNPSLRTLEGLEQVRQIGTEGEEDGGTLEIEDNERLVSLRGLENLQSVPFARIDGNSSLRSIDALRDLEYVRGMVIKNNPSLSTCAINALVEDLEARIPDFVGAEVENNLDDGC